MIRDRIQADQVVAMKAGDKPRTAALRLILAAVKNRDIELRTGAPPSDDDAMVAELLHRMIKQRRESIALYEQGGREELASAERAEMAVIEAYLPAQMDEGEARAAIEAIVGEIGASSLKDMGKVMALLKERHGKDMDLGVASALVKARLMQG